MCKGVWSEHEWVLSESVFRERGVAMRKRVWSE